MSDKLKVFLSGGMSNIPEEDSKKWRRLFKQVGCLNSSVAPISLRQIYIDPTKLYKPSNPYDQAYEREAMNYDFYCVKEADVIVVNFNSLLSVGTAQEIAYACVLGKPIIGMIEENKYDQLHPWYKEECFKIFKYNSNELKETIEKIIKYIDRFNLKEEIKYD